MNKRLAYFLAALAMAAVALTPAKASAGWGWWGGPGISITWPALGLRVLRLPSVWVLWLRLSALLWASLVRLLRLWSPRSLGTPCTSPMALTGVAT